MDGCPRDKLAGKRPHISAGTSIYSKHLPGKRMNVSVARL
jgi:hypothetical protein